MDPPVSLQLGAELPSMTKTAERISAAQAASETVRPLDPDRIITLAQTRRRNRRNGAGIALVGGGGAAIVAVVTTHGSAGADRPATLIPLPTVDGRRADIAPADPGTPSAPSHAEHARADL
jgi:hypothetical protein